MRYLVIGRLPRLAVFNGSVVSVRERADAEKTYLRAILREHRISLATALDEAEELTVTLNHPRFLELKLKYQEDLLPLFQSDDSTGPRNLAADLVNIKLLNMSGFGAAEADKKLPGSLTIAKLRVLIKQLYGIDPAEQLLSLRTSKGGIPVVLDDDESSLSYFGACDGSEVFINVK